VLLHISLNILVLRDFGMRYHTNVLYLVMLLVGVYLYLRNGVMSAFVDGSGGGKVGEMILRGRK